jgi:hypothetical protein
LSVTVLSLNPEDAYRSVWRYGNPPTVLLGAYDTFPVFSLGLVGTAQLGFERSRYQLQDRNGHIIYGLPVLGFSAIRATLEGGSGSALANFSVTHRHHMKTTVETADTP